MFGPWQHCDEIASSGAGSFFPTHQDPMSLLSKTDLHFANLHVYYILLIFQIPGFTEIGPGFPGFPEIDPDFQDFQNWGPKNISRNNLGLPHIGKKL